MCCRISGFLNELIKYEQVLKFSEKPLTPHFAKHDVRRASLSIGFVNKLFTHSKTLCRIFGFLDKYEMLCYNHIKIKSGQRSPEIVVLSNFAYV